MFHSLLSDYLFDNEVDYDDYDDNTEENHPFSELPLSTVTPADIEGRVRSLEEIFSSLHISSEGCQKMLVCHLSKVSNTTFLLKYKPSLSLGSGGVQSSVPPGAGPTGA